MDKEKIYIILSFATIYIVWGATYLFVAYAVEEIAPFFMSGVRYILASIILISFATLIKGWKPPTRKQAINASIVGMLFLGLGTTGVAWALQTVDTGFTSLLISTEPLIIVLMLWVLNRKPPALQSFLGIALGISGIYLLVSQSKIVVSMDHWQGVMAIVFAQICWGLGTIYIGRADMPRSQETSTSLQMFTGGIIAFIISFAIEDNPVEWSSLSWTAMGSLAFLILFGSILAFSAFNYLLLRVSPEKVATGTYVNPIIALILGWWFRDELITFQSLIAAVLMLGGVFFINSARSRKSVSTA